MSHSNQTFDSEANSCDSSSHASTLKTERVDREDCMKCLLNIFDHTDFEVMQWEIISSILNDKSDTLVTMASVSGKSLCFQFPSVYLDTITIVVTPFISLMQDQVSKNFPKVKAYFFGSGQTNKEEIEDIVMNYNILYVTPEYITSYGEALLQNKVLYNRLSMIAFDEAHYISCWGDGFRNAYADLWKLREWCPSVPFLTSTATPSKKIRNDIIEILRLREPQFFSCSVDRPNLKYIVKERSETIWESIKPYINDEKNSSIVIYCVTRYEANEVAKAIYNALDSSDDLRIYHPYVPTEERNQIVEDFHNNKIRIVVGTIAFGMGMDKSNVRLVIFYRVPLRFDDFFILSGLAGRDGLPAQCLLLHSFEDKQKIFDILEFYNERNPSEKTDETWDIFKNYIETPACRRNFILSLYEEDISKLTSRSDCCDNCEVKLCHLKSKKIDE